jgi:hypothetical protein
MRAEWPPGKGRADRPRTVDPIVVMVGAEADNRLYAFWGDTGELLASPPEQLRGLH